MSSGKKRRVWLVIVITVMAMVFVVLPVGYTIWTNIAEHRVHALIAQYHAAGEPILPEDFDTSPIPDATNAVVDVRAAIAAMPTTRESSTLEPILIEVNDETRPISAAEAQRLQDVLNQCGRSLADIPTAVAKPAVDWQIKYRTSTLITLVLPDLNGMRRLSNLLDADAAVAHCRGDHAHAVESLRQALLLARIAPKQRNLVSGLVGIGQNIVAAGEIQRIAPTLHIGTGTGDAAPAQVRGLIDQLLQDAASRRAYHDCLLGERMFELDLCRNFTAGANQQQTGGMSAFKPIALQDGAILSQNTTKVAAAVNAADYPAAQAAMPADPKQSYSPVLHPLVSILGPSLTRAVNVSFRSYTEDRLAAVALAARWYAVDHNGKLPATLNDLVPTYLPEIPLDPMAAGKPLGYIVTKDRTVVYSVGESGIDEQANEAPMNPKHPNQAGPHSWNAHNFVVPLEPAPLPGAGSLVR